MRQGQGKRLIRVTGYHRLVALAVATGGALACQIIAGLETPEAPPIDAGLEGPGVVAVLAPNACDDSTPRPPTKVNAPGTEDQAPIDLVLGYIRSDVSRPPDAGVELCESTGFNFDDRTTCTDNGQRRPVPECAGDAACSWGPSCVNKVVTCDEPGGTDNSLGALLSPANASLFPGIDTSSLDANEALRAGAANVLIRITGYNGQPDDDKVAASFFLSSGVASVDQPLVRPVLIDSGQTLDDAGDAGIGSDPTAERWDGRALREWYLDPSGLVSDTVIKSTFDATGYVSNHVLVLDDAVIPLPVINNVLILFEHGRLVGELRSRGRAWEIVRGRIGGRITTGNAIRAIAAIPFSTAGKQKHIACGDDRLMTLVQAYVCRAADLADGGNVPCSSLSFGIGFLAVPAIISGTVSKPNSSFAYCDAGDFARCSE